MKKYKYTTFVAAFPAYNRRPVTWDDALSWFTRGWDYKGAVELGAQYEHFAITDCAPGCHVCIHFGKALQKSKIYVIPTKEEQALARLQAIDIPIPFPSDTAVKAALQDVRPTRSQINRWAADGQLSALITIVVLKVR